MDKNKIMAEYFDHFKEQSKSVYEFVGLQNEYGNAPRVYGENTQLTMVEIHTLVDIEENPGITITELARMWRRTKGAVSQTVTRLESKGLINRIRDRVNARKVQLFTNDEGTMLSRIHKEYDVNDLRITLSMLLDNCTMDEIGAFHKVISVYNKLLIDELGE